MKLISLILLAASACCVNAFSVTVYARADVVAVVTVAAGKPRHVNVRVVDADGKTVGGTVNGVFRLTNIVALKGTIGTEALVLGEAPWDGPGPHGGRNPVVPPVGTRLLVALQSAHEGRFLEDVSSNLPPEESKYAVAPDGVQVRFLEYHGGFTWLDLGKTPVDLPVRHDFLYYDFARVLVASGITEDTSDARSLLPSPGVYDFKHMPDESWSNPDIQDCRRLMGPNPAAFYKAEIEPHLKPATNDAEGLWRLTVAGSWGVPGASAQIADIVLAAGEISDASLARSAALAASFAARWNDGSDAARRLLGSRNDTVLIGVSQQIQYADRKGLAPEVFRLLDNANPEVLRAAMFALSAMYHDHQHRPKLGRQGGFEEGSFNAGLVQYWKSKR